MPKIGLMNFPPCAKTLSQAPRSTSKTAILRRFGGKQKER